MTTADVQPTEHLFNPPTLPTTLQSGSDSNTAAVQFAKYQSSLRQQLAGRTPLLNDVLSTLERHASDLHRDLASMLASDRNVRWASSPSVLCVVLTRIAAMWLKACLIPTALTQRLSVRGYVTCLTIPQPMQVRAVLVSSSSRF